MFRDAFLNTPTEYYTKFSNFCDLLKFKDSGEIAMYVCAQSDVGQQQNQATMYEIPRLNAISSLLGAKSELPVNAERHSVYDTLIYLKSHLEDIINVYYFFQDDLSRQTFLRLLTYILFRKETGLEEICDYSNILQKNTNSKEVMTIEELLENAGRVAEQETGLLFLRYFRRANGSHSTVLYFDDLEQEIAGHLDENINDILSELQRLAELNETYQEALRYAMRSCQEKKAEEVFSILAVADEACKASSQIMERYFSYYETDNAE